MPAVIIRHKIKDDATWRAAFAEQQVVRRANGCHGSRLFRNAVDPDEVIIVLEWDELARAQLFARSAVLRDAMARAGVAEDVDFLFLKDADDRGA